MGAIAPIAPMLLYQATIFQYDFEFLFKEWVEDSWMEVTCDNDDNNDDEGSGCATGQLISE